MNEEEIVDKHIKIALLVHEKCTKANEGFEWALFDLGFRSKIYEKVIDEINSS